MQCKRCSKNTNSRSGYCKDCVFEISCIINSNIHSIKECIRAFYRKNSSTLIKADMYEEVKEKLKILNSIKDKYYEIINRCKSNIPFIEKTNLELEKMKKILNKEIQDKLKRKEETMKLIEAVQKKEELDC